MRILIVLMSALVISCSTTSNLFGPGTPGYIGTYESKVDKVKTMYMEPGWIANTMLKLGHRWHSSMKPDDLWMDVTTNGLVRILDKDSLTFLVDNEKFSFSPHNLKNDYSTSPGYAGGGIYIAPSNWTSRTFKLKKNFVQRLLNAKEVYVKLSTDDGFIEGPLHTSGPTTYKSSAVVFLKKLDEFQK